MTRQPASFRSVAGREMKQCAPLQMMGFRSMGRVARAGRLTRRGIVVVGAIGLLGCSDSKSSGDRGASLPAGPVSVTLPNIDANRLRVLTRVGEFVVLDARGNLRWGKPRGGPTPWAGEPAERPRGFGASIHYEFDSHGKLSSASSATSLILADTATPARITLRDGIQAYSYQSVALAAGAANLAVPYEFGDEPWQDTSRHADLTVRADRFAPITTKPHTVLLQFTDATTTGELLTALTAIAETGAERVRLHRMMGRGEIGPGDIVWVHGPSSDDDEVRPGRPTKIIVENVRVDETLSAHEIQTALLSDLPRFRYCYEKGGFAQPSTIEVGFDVAANGTIGNVSAKGHDHALESCISGAIQDRRESLVERAGVGHAAASIVFDRVEVEARKESKRNTGFWCWVHQSRRQGMCARDQEECEALSTSFNRVAAAAGSSTNTNACNAQKTAWRGEGMGGEVFLYPSKAVCTTIDTSCREVR